jgi:hypothetical protein
MGLRAKNERTAADGLGTPLERKTVYRLIESCTGKFFIGQLLPLFDRGGIM